MASSPMVSGSDPSVEVTPTMKERIVQGIHQFGMLREGDSESVMAQKIMILVFAVLSVPIFGLGAYFWSQLPNAIRAHHYIGLLVASVCLTAYFLTFALGYIVLRLRNGHLAPLHTICYWFCIEGLWVAIVLADPNFSAPVGCIAMFICQLVTNPPLLPLHFIAPASIAIFDILNQSFKTKIHLPEVRFGPSGEHFVAMLVVWSALVLALLTIYAKTVSSAAMAQRSQNSTDMSNEVVALLQSYNTEKVKVRLAEFRSSRDVDLKLLDALNAMNDNLERYRPHLPNYILMPDTDDEGSVHSGDEGTAQDDERDPQGSPRKGEEMATDQISQDSRHSRRSGSSLRDRTEATSVHTAHSSEHQYNPHKLSVVHQRGGDRLYVGRITLAEVDFIRLPLEGRSNWLPILIDAVYESAAMFQGSIHSLLGDTLTVSWNATRRVAQSELKATRFLYKVQRAMAEKGFAVCGAACTGSAACESVQSSTGQQAFLVHCRWRDALHVLATLAARCHSVLIDEATNTVAHYDFDTRSVDQLSYVSPTNGQLTDPTPWFLVNGIVFKGHRSAACLPHSRSSMRLNANGGDTMSPSQPDLPVSNSEAGKVYLTVFELVAEFKRADDEWMYQLEEGAGARKSMSAEITQAMTRIIRGEFGEAAASLQPILGRLELKRSLRQVDSSSALPHHQPQGNSDADPTRRMSTSSTPSTAHDTTGSGNGVGFVQRMLDYCEYQLLH